MLLKLCPKCKRVVGYNSYFNAYYCTDCGNMFVTEEIKPIEEIKLKEKE